MGTLRVGAARRRPHRDGVRAPAVRTTGGLAKRLRWAVLWLLVFVLVTLPEWRLDVGADAERVGSHTPCRVHPDPARCGARPS